MRLAKLCRPDHQFVRQIVRQSRPKNVLESLENRRLFSSSSDAIARVTATPTCGCSSCPRCGGTNSVAFEDLLQTEVRRLTIPSYTTRLNTSSSNFGRSLGTVSRGAVSRGVSTAFYQPLSSLPAAQGRTQSVFPTQATAFTADLTQLTTALRAAPLDPTAIRYNQQTNISSVKGVNTDITAAPLTFSLPTPGGTTERFNIWRSQVMAPELEAKFPSFSTYIGQGIDDPSANLALSITSLGLQASVFSAGGSWYIDPIYNLSTDGYVAYERKDVQRISGGEFRCTIHGDNLNDVVSASSSVANPGVRPSELSGGGAVTIGSQLKVYDLAVSTTGEWGTDRGGITNANAAVTQSVVRLNQVYERDLGIRMQLVANNNLLVYVNAGTDPFTSQGNASATFNQNQTNVDAIIGNANYDIGHVYARGVGGEAGAIGNVGVAGQKAQGYTAGVVTGDPFVIDYLAHEIGHQFGGRHNFSSSGGGPLDSANIAVEPGSGTTILGYANLGTAAENVQNSSDAMFGSISIDQITAYVSSGAGLTSATIVATGNTAPAVSVVGGTAFNIPARTPFRLTASASDINGDTLTYSWEQRNGAGGISGSPSATNTTGPTFRVNLPSTNPQRLFPRLSTILTGSTGPFIPATANPSGEQLPSVTRTLNFRAVVRDNRAGGGGIQDVSATVTTNANTTPFQITNFNTVSSLAAGSSTTLSWAVSNTAVAPINTTLVNILLSTNGGASFPITLLAATANDGSQIITIPSNISAVSNARILIEPVGNIYFDINNANIAITAPVSSAVPSIPSADTATDTGVSNSDRITQFNNSTPSSRLSFTVSNTVSGALVEILADGDGGVVVVGSATATGSSTIVLTNGSTTLADGVRNFTSRQTESGRTASTSPSNVAVTIDTVRPTSIIQSFNRDTGPAQVLSASFSESVVDVAGSGLDVVNLGPGVSPAPSTVSGSGNTRTFNFGGTLDRGNYTAAFNSTGTDVAGNSILASSTINFRFFAGDADNSGGVDFNDLVLLARNFNQSGKVFSDGDFDYSGTVDFNDLVILARNFNQSLPVLSPLSALPLSSGSAFAARSKTVGRDVLA